MPDSHGARPPANAYKVLQVDPEADPEVIQAAYRRLARKYHPDVTDDPAAPERMAAINAAWNVLKDAESRAAYDRELSGTPVGAPRQEQRAENHGAAGSPPGRSTGSRLTFGRYAGWTLGEIAGRDAEYLEWLDRMPIGRPHRLEIDQLLRRAGRRRSDPAAEPERRGLFRRR